MDSRIFLVVLGSLECLVYYFWRLCFIDGTYIHDYNVSNHDMFHKVAVLDGIKGCVSISPYIPRHGIPPCLPLLSHSHYRPS